MKIRLLLSFILLIAPYVASANDLGDYIPPPLFGGGEDISETVPDDVKASVYNPPPSPQNIAKPLSKPKTNFAKSLPIEEKKAKSIIIEKAEKLKVEEEHQGVVKGPKTMPAVKKQNVEAEVTFTPEHKNPEPMLKPAPIKTEVKKEEKVKAETPSPLSKEKSWNLDFEGVNEKLSAIQKETILTQIIPHLDANGKASLQIESFAFSDTRPQSLNQDRRIALNRALAVRGFLLENEITSSRIDVRTMLADQSNSDLNQVQIQLIE